MTVYLSSPPELAEKAAIHGSVSIMAYRMGYGFHLYRRSFPKIHPAIMDIDCSGFTGFGPHRILAREIVCECRFQRFIGVSLGLTSHPTPPISAFCSVLSHECSQYGIALYIPVEFYSCLDCNCKLLVDTRPCCPPFSTRLKTFADRFGSERLALELDRAYMDFTLPSGGIFSLNHPSQSQPAVISEDDFNSTYGHLRSFQSAPHMSRYVTDIRGRSLHIVFGDDEECVRRKLEFAEKLGVREAFAYYPQFYP